MAEPVVVFVLRMDEAGKLSWNSSLPAPMLNLALDGVKQDILTGKVNRAPTIVAPTNGQVQAVKRVVP